MWIPIVMGLISIEAYFFRNRKKTLLKKCAYTLFIELLFTVFVINLDRTKTDLVMSGFTLACVLLVLFAAIELVMKRIKEKKSTQE